LGTIAAGARADILVIGGTGGPADEAYAALIHAKETDIRLVMINGVARYGVPALMGLLSPDDQTVKVGCQSRKLYLKQETCDPDVAVVSLSKATSQLRAALLNIATLAKEVEKPKAVAARKLALDATAKPVWSLALDEIQDRGEDIRPRLPFNGPSDFTGAKRAAVKVTAAAPPLSSILKPIQLDPLTVADDPGFLNSIELQLNLPEAVKSNLRGLY